MSIGNVSVLVPPPPESLDGVLTKQDDEGGFYSKKASNVVDDAGPCAIPRGERRFVLCLAKIDAPNGISRLAR